MSEIIQCPTCAKKFRLPDNPPAEFTCTSCGTVMDLSGFAAATPAPAAQPARAAGGRRGGRGRRSAGPAAPVSKHERAAAAHKRRRRAHGRGGADAVHEEFGHAGQRYHRKDNSNALLIGSIAALAVAAILIFVLMGQDDETPEDPAKKGPKTTAQNPAGTGTGTMPIQPTPLDPSGAMPGAPGKLPGGPGVVPGTPGANPGATAPDNPNPTPKKRRTRPRVSQIELKKFDWPDEVDAATRAAAEEHLENMVEIGGRDGRDAEDWFRAQGRKICGRLISEFPVIIERYGMERQGMMRLMVIDRVLSTIDGTLEREWKSRQRIHHVSDPKIAMARLKRWTYWWESGLWKDTPVKPWDPREDEVDPEAAKKDDAGRGFGKRAGK